MANATEGNGKGAVAQAAEMENIPDRGENRLFVIIVLAHEAISIGI